MSMFADKDLQAKLLKEIQELYEKRVKLENDIRAVDAVSKLRMEKAALRDIDAYKSLLDPRRQRSNERV